MSKCHCIRYKIPNQVPSANKHLLRTSNPLLLLTNWHHKIKCEHYLVKITEGIAVNLNEVTAQSSLCPDNLKAGDDFSR